MSTISRTVILKNLLILSLPVLLFSCSGISSSDSLKEGFISPPDSTRPGVYWYFMDGNIEREGITRDLESMKDAGIGYALFLEVNVGIPRGKVDFLSEEWQELFKHAVREAERLGIRIILGSGPGWAGSGGPWVSPAQSMMHLVASDTTVTGPARFDNLLVVPKPRIPYFGEGSVPQSLKEPRNTWYRDVCVMAFPTPTADKRIDLIDEKALYYRAPYTSVKNVLPYLPSHAEFNEVPGSAIDINKIILLSDKTDESGRLKWDIPPGKWTILRFVMRNNGAVTRPAPVPGLGFEADKFDTISFDSHFNSYIGKLIRKVNPKKPDTGGGWTMIHIDSWEMGAQNWSPDFSQQFRKRRGYNPTLYLPVFTGRFVGSNETSERFLWDLRETSNELIMENHAERFKDLGCRYGFRLSIEPYDMNPAADFDLGSVADVPMCEFWSAGFGFNSAFSCIEGTSIGHVAGKPVIAAEAFTADNNEAWKKYPENMKNQGDWAFCMGINRLVYHTFAHKPYGDKYRPGLTMGPYGVHWDRGQTWWPLIKGYHKYITRCQYLLSQGKPVADILYVTPQGAPQVFVPPVSALEGTSILPDKKGYSFDECSPLYLTRQATVKDNMIVFPGGASYKILVLPDVQTFTPEFLNKLDSLIMEGATVIGNPVKKSPSLSGYPDCDMKVREIAEKVWGKVTLSSVIVCRQYGKGKVFTGEDIYKRSPDNPDINDTLALYPDYSQTAVILNDAGIIPDFKASGGIRYTHRSLEDREIYFISNRTGSEVKDTCYFRSGTKIAELWDAVTGEIRKIPDILSSCGMTCVPVKLAPGQSFFIVFYKMDKKAESHKNHGKNFPDQEILMTLDGPWTVAFDTLWGGPEIIKFDSLCDWSTRSEEGIKYYSGKAVYSKTFNLPETVGSLKNPEICLDLGKVRNIADVKLNGKELGIVWTTPWQVNIKDAVRQKNNRLEITVINLWINRLIGDETEPWDGIEKGKWPEWFINGTNRPSKRYTFTTHHYYKKGDPLVESGLIGPVRIEILK
jgi:hypothetical protein